jgi:hypothetical protein
MSKSKGRIKGKGLSPFEDDFSERYTESKKGNSDIFRSFSEGEIKKRKIKLADLDAALDSSYAVCALDSNEINCLTNAERGNDRYTAAIDHKMSMLQARRVLEFFGCLADAGYDPVKELVAFVKNAHDLV